MAARAASSMPDKGLFRRPGMMVQLSTEQGDCAHERQFRKRRNVFALGCHDRRRQPRLGARLMIGFNRFVGRRRNIRLRRPSCRRRRLFREQDARRAGARTVEDQARSSKTAVVNRPTNISMLATTCPKCVCGMHVAAADGRQRLDAEKR